MRKREIFLCYVTLLWGCSGGGGSGEPIEPREPVAVQPAPISCSPNGAQVLLLVETSEMMAEPSGFNNGNKALSRFELVKDALKRSLPHLKKQHSFGLLTFPYTGQPKGGFKAQGSECGVGDIQVQPGQPYGWIVSTLEHVDLFGKAATAAALARARQWFQANPAPGKERVVMLFGAGGDSCGGDVLAEVQALKAMGVATIVYAPENAPEFSGTLSFIAKAGGRPNPANPTGVYPLVPNLDPIFDDSVLDTGVPEMCDGIDNDCDGQTDEDVFEACETACGKGFRTCQMVEVWEVVGFRIIRGRPGFDDATGEFLPGFDDVYQIPIYKKVLRPGWSECIIDRPNKELCDGVDNDCDGLVDEDFDVGALCTAGQGACAGVGRFVCAPDGLGVVCDAIAKTPSPEVCDGMDNDCDGVVDNITEECDTSCGKGYRLCVQGQWGSCQITKPNPELCNGKDDDCDGLVDENYDVGQPCTVGAGNCAVQGVKVCTPDGLGTFCKVSGKGESFVELCDGVDNDCDGLTDEGPTCPAGQVCFKGQCVYD